MKTDLTFISRYSHCPLCGSSRIMQDFHLEIGTSKILYSVCQDCDLVFQNPRLDETSIKNIYGSLEYWGGGETTKFSAYSEYAKFDYVRIRQSTDRLKKIMKISGIKNGKLLDVGCATGFFGSVAQQGGFEVLGIEPSPLMAEFGRKNYKINILCSILEESTLQNEFYDIITLWGTDSHFLNPWEGFSKLVATLKTGGTFAMNYQHFGHWIRRLFPGLKKSPNAIYNLSDRSVNFILQKMNLQLLYRGLEWQWVPTNHFFHLVKWSVPNFLMRGAILLPALSFRFIVAKKL